MTEQNSKWKEELASRSELSPDELLTIFPKNLIDDFDTFQINQINKSFTQFLQAPLPFPKDENEEYLQKILKSNVNTYEDIEHQEEFWDILYEDSIIVEMTNARAQNPSKYSNDELYSQALRIRIGIVAHQLFSEIQEMLNLENRLNEGAA